MPHWLHPSCTEYSGWAEVHQPGACKVGLCTFSFVCTYVLVSVDLFVYVLVSMHVRVLYM